MNRIMLIEDDATMRSLLKTLLEMEGFQIILYGESGLKDILEDVRQAKPDAMILDVHLRTAQNHEINGMDVLRQIRSDPAVRHVKALMVSGMDLRAQCMAAGADQFLLKPYMPDELINWLKSLNLQQ